MKYRSIYYLLIALGLSTFLFSCKKDVQTDFTGKWKVIEYAKYTDGESATFQEGLPYWFLQRYSQGVEITGDDMFLYRYADPNGILTTSMTESGAWRLEGDQMIFSIPNDDDLVADILSIENGVLWLKYIEGAHTLEYKLVRE